MFTIKFWNTFVAFLKSGEENQLESVREMWKQVCGEEWWPWDEENEWLDSWRDDGLETDREKLLQAAAASLEEAPAEVFRDVILSILRAR